MRGARQTAANLYQIPAGGACAFLVVEDRITVIDAGRRGSGPRILEYLRSLGRSPEEISYIISTHYHLDHIGGIAHLQAASAVTRSCAYPFHQPAACRSPSIQALCEAAQRLRGIFQEGRIMT